MDQWLLAQDGIIVYLSLFFALMGGAIGLPIPEDIPLLVAGALIYKEIGNPYAVLAVCYISIIIGDFLIFLIGRRLGPTLFNKSWFRSRIPPSKIRHVRFNLERRSLLMIFIARHLFYLRTVTFLACGAVKMRASRFLLADATAALISVPIMASIGYFLMKQYGDLTEAGYERVMHRIEVGSLLVGVGVATYIAYRLWIKRKTKRNSASCHAKQS